MADIRCPLHEAARISRDAPALRWADDELTYYEFDRYVSGAAQRLHAAGLRAGDRIGLLESGSWQSIVSFFGVLRLGAVVCPLSRRLPPAAVASHLAHVDAAALLAEEEVPGLALRQLSIGETARSAGRPAPDIECLRPALDRDATVVFTSGSSGTPKAVLHTHGNHYYSALGSNHNVRIRSKQTWMLSVPISHVSGIGILYRCLLGGASVLLPKRGVDLADSLSEQKPTHLSVVPTQLLRLLRHGAPCESLKTLVVGGGPIPQEWIEQAVRHRWPIFCTYGLTEMASQVTTEPIGQPISRRGTAGALLRHRELRIGDDDEILVRGQTLFKGYIEGDTLRRPLDRDGWFATGDLGALDDEGLLTVAGRKDTQFVSGGENIHPEAIEDALAALDGVGRSLVVPVPHPEYGQRPVAFVQLRDPSGDLASLAERLRQRLPGFMVPDHFFPWPDDLDTGLKTQRRPFTERAVALLRSHPGEP